MVMPNTLQDTIECWTRAYLHARRVVIAQGYSNEIDWQDSRRFERVTESQFLREAAWVVLSAGMSERVVRGVFPRVSAAFLDWSSATAIVRSRNLCLCAATAAFAHERKIDAIASIADRINEAGFACFKARVAADWFTELCKLDYIGPVTSFHLAKNLGLDLVKADRHLVRIAEAAGAESPRALCCAIASATGDRLATIDVVLWRFATLIPSYLDAWSAASRRHLHDE